ncbi:MAG: tRNA (guanosine(37)-N1)-methyltransferase TrmD [Bryobacterales bacterium]|nr:tRNA (guanosine(37)-N1)-methyltransferase TrmD [Bryobacterales bacterium]
MKFHIVTIFPDFFVGPMGHGVLKKAQEAGRVEVLVHDLRNWTSDRHRTVDDRPFGGGEGMLLKPEPLFDAVESIWPDRAQADLPKSEAGAEAAPWKRVLLLSAQGRRFDQAMARRLAELDELLLICGRYEGVDERVAEHLADDEISVGDFVLSGGELAAAMVVDVVARLIPGVLGNEASAVHESFGASTTELGFLDCPQYTRPAEFRGWKVPEVLLSGNHAEIREWREHTAREKTARMRPDLLDKVRGCETPSRSHNSGETG